MAALTKERLTDFAGTLPSRGTYPVAANVKIFKGAIVVLDSAGRARPGTNAAGGAVICVGKASATFDNTGGSAGAFDVEVEFGTYGYETLGGGDLIEADDVGKLAYVADDQTLSIVSTGRIAAGPITEVRNGQVFVWMGPHVFPLTA
jgi:hypothetical protein